MLHGIFNSLLRFIIEEMQFPEGNPVQLVRIPGLGDDKPDIADWTKGDICFSEAGIDAVTQSLERRFGVYISYSSGEEYRNAAITAKFIRGQSLEEILDVLKRLIPGMDYTIIGDHIYLE